MDPMSRHILPQDILGENKLIKYHYNSKMGENNTSRSNEITNNIQILIPKCYTVHSCVVSIT